jgi:chromosome segregation ATPase
MPNSEDDDMDDAPITRREFREFREDLEAKLKASEQRTEQRFDTKLEHWGGALLHAIKELDKRVAEVPTRAEIETRFAQVDQRFAQVDQRFTQLERHVSSEIAQHTRASNEESRGQLAAIDEKYADLPARMTRVEDQLFKPKP